MIFTATSRLCFRSRARKTRAIPPRPTSRWTLYRPPSRSGGCCSVVSSNSPANRSAAGRSSSGKSRSHSATILLNSSRRSGSPLLTSSRIAARRSTGSSRTASTSGPNSAQLDGSSEPSLSLTEKGRDAGAFGLSASHAELCAS